MAIILARAISWFAELLTMALVLRAILSWFAQDPYSTLGKAYRVMIKITEPIVGPCRNLIYRLNINTGMFDFSVLLAFFLVNFVAKILIRLILVIML